MVRFKVMWSNLNPATPPIRQKESPMKMSDEALLKRLNVNPALRSRVESILLVVDDEMGTLQEADAAEMQLIEQMRKMGQESLQTWATGQAAKAAENVARQSKTWREGKKNSNGTAHLAK